MPSPNPSEESQDEWMSRCTDHPDIPDGQEGVDKCLAMWPDSETEKSSDEQGGTMSWLEKVFGNDQHTELEKLHETDFNSMTDEQIRMKLANISATVESLVNRARDGIQVLVSRNKEIPNNLVGKIVRSFSGGKIASEGDPELIDDDVEDGGLEDHVPEGVEKSDMVAVAGPKRARVAFVGAYPSKIDMIRDESFTGPVGKTLRESYMSRLGIDKAEALRFNVIPVYREEFTKTDAPSEEEVEKWDEYANAVLDEYEPQTVVALGKTANEVLGDRADEWVPHPRIVNMRGETDEIARKMGRLREKVEKTEDPIYFEKSEGIQVEILKSDNERQIVYGTPLVPDEEDADGNWTTEEEIGKAIEHYMKNHIHKTDHEHYKDLEDGVYVVESIQVPADMTFNGNPVKKGSWLVGVKIEDEDRWNMVKSGEYRGFSFEGAAQINPNNRLE